LSTEYTIGDERKVLQSRPVIGPAQADAPIMVRLRRRLPARRYLDRQFGGM